MDFIYGIGSDEPDKIEKLNALKKKIRELHFEAKLNAPHQLICKRESTNELFILSTEVIGDKDVMYSTGLCISVIDLDTLYSENEDIIINKYTIAYLSESKENEEEEKNENYSHKSLESFKNAKLTTIDNPHKIFLNSIENIMIIQSQKYIAIVPLNNSKIDSDQDFKFELQLVNQDEIFSDSINNIIEAKFHPLTPYTLCVLMSCNKFKMYELTQSLDESYYSAWLRPNDSSQSKQKLLSISDNKSIVGFDFGSQCALSWNKFTCYFMTADGCIYYLLPLFPIRFGIETGILEKLSQTTEDEEISNFLTLLVTKKQFHSSNSCIVSLEQTEYDTLKLDLQGPILFKNSPIRSPIFCGIYSMNCFPQTLITCNLNGEIFVNSTFKEPSLRSIKIEREDGTLEDDFKFITKEQLELESDKKTSSEYVVPLIIYDRQNKSSFYALYGKNLCKIEIPWLSIIHKQFKVCNSKQMDGKIEEAELVGFIEIAAIPENNSKISTLCEFKESENGCIGFIPILNSVFIILSDPDTSKLSLNIELQKQQAFTEIREYVEEIISKKPLISQLVDNKQIIEKIRLRAAEYKGLEIDKVQISVKSQNLDEKTFLKEFTRIAHIFSSDVVKKLTTFKIELLQQKEINKELKTKSENLQKESIKLVDIIKEKKQKYKSLYDKTIIHNSEIAQKIERIRAKLKDHLPKITNMPLSRVEEESLRQITDIERQTILMSNEVAKEIMRFQKTREFENNLFKQNKIKLDKEKLESDIEPNIKKLNDIKEYLQRVKEELKRYKDQI